MRTSSHRGTKAKSRPARRTDEPGGSDRPGAPDNAGKGAPAPQTETPPQPPNAYLAFTTRLRQIYAGQYQRTSLLYEPLAAFNRIEDDFVCYACDRTAQELFSYSRELEDQATHLPSPKSLNDVDGHLLQQAILRRLRDHALDLFWAEVRAVYANCAAEQAISIRTGWRVVREEAPDRRPENPFEFFGSPAELFERISRLQAVAQAAAAGD